MTHAFRPTRLIQAVALFIAMVFIAPMVTTAQEVPPIIATDQAPRTITVTGVGTVQVAPDTADITFGVYIQNESLEVAQNEASTRLDGIMQALTDAGIAEEDVATSNYSIFVINEYDRDGNLVGVQGYEVFSSVTVTIRDISTVGTLLDDVVGAGANEVSAISFYVEDTDAAANQARVAAVEDARAKADVLAEASGVLVVGVYSIDEVSAPDPMPFEYDMGAGDAMAVSEESRAVPIAPGQAEIMVEVDVVFEIEQPQG